MRALLDTHAFVVDYRRPRFSPCAREIIGAGENLPFLSAPGGWEMAITSNRPVMSSGRYPADALVSLECGGKHIGLLLLTLRQ